jgi:hypothetical protein
MPVDPGVQPTALLGGGFTGVGQKFRARLAVTGVRDPGAYKVPWRLRKPSRGRDDRWLRPGRPVQRSRVPPSLVCRRALPGEREQSMAGSESDADPASSTSRKEGQR